MSSFPLDITSISILLSILSLVVATVAVLFAIRNPLKKVKGDNEIDAFALVQEFRNRNQALEEKLVDLRVRLEILDLRLARIAGKGGTTELSPQNSVKLASSREALAQTPVLSPVLHGRARVVATLDPIRREILSAVKDASGSATSRDIQLRIGRSREHVARMMNLLQKQGLLHRNQEARPFSYSITKDGESELRIS